MNTALYFAAMWLSEVWYSRILPSYSNKEIAYCRARGTIMFDRVMTGRIPVVRDIETAPQLHLVRK